LKKTKNHLIESDQVFSAQKYLPKPSSKTTQPNPPKKERLNQHFSSRFHRAHFAPKELDMTLIALNTSKEQQVKLDLDGMAGQICVVFCFNAEACFFWKKNMKN